MIVFLRINIKRNRRLQVFNFRNDTTYFGVLFFKSVNHITINYCYVTQSENESITFACEYSQTILIKKQQIMKLTNFLPITALVIVTLMGSCTKEAATTGSSLSNTASQLSSKSGVYATTKDANGKPVKPPKTGSQAAVDLGVAGNFVILSKSGITDVYPSIITGSIGSSPITGAAILVKCDEVTGSIFSVDAAGPLPCRLTNASMLTTAVLNMQTAYTDAAGRSKPDFLNLGAGTIGGLTLTPGLYKWTTSVVIPTNIIISGGPNDIFIFQVAKNLTMSSAVKVILSGGAQAKNIFWQVAGAVTFGTTSHFEGNVLGQTGINLQTGASINGRLLAQTAVTLQMNTVNIPQ